MRGTSPRASAHATSAMGYNDTMTATMSKAIRREAENLASEIAWHLVPEGAKYDEYLAKKAEVEPKILKAVEECLR